LTPEERDEFEKMNENDHRDTSSFRLQKEFQKRKLRHKEISK